MGVTNRASWRATSGKGLPRMGVGELSKPRLARMHDVMAAHVEHGGIPGIITLVSRRGETHVEAIGVKTRGDREPIERDAIFRISSLTKPITAAATMLLIEECRIRLDEPVDRLLPELANRRVLRTIDAPLDDTVPAHRPITIRDLLTFTMGFGLVMAPPDTYPIQKAMTELRLGQGPPSPSMAPPPDEWMRRLGSLPLMHQPGEQWMYNTGADVLGVLIARASGVSFEQFLKQRLFEPLGMKDTAFSVPAAESRRLVTGYAYNPETKRLEVFDSTRNSQWGRPPAFPAGSAGLVSTIDDYFAFGQMMLAYGRVGKGRLLSRPAVELMTTDHLSPAQKAVSGLGAGYFDSHGWGFGLSVSTRRDTLASVPGRFGWDGGLGTSWYADPEEEMIGILMSQCAWGSGIPPAVCQDFWTLAYQAIDD